MKTLAIRLDDDVHAQLSIVAQLRDSNITEVIRTAIEAYLDAARTDPALAAQADEVLAGIDAEASKRRDAIGALFQPAESKPARRGRKPATDTE